jgi:hypothetical protein
MSAESDEMSVKEKVEAYISLYKQQMDRFNRTQDVEWKANFGVWALLAGSIYFVAQRSVILPSCLVAIILVAFCVVHCGWLLFIHDSQRIDKDLWKLYRRKAAEILICDVEQEKLLSHSEWYRGPRIRELLWTSFEVGITALLCLLLFVMLHKTQLSPGTPMPPVQSVEHSPPA